jgi:D-glycero-alpha-D-manno-heptose-7-phosphate kinase
MIISRTPFRISFFGGGTDYPGWYMENGGAVLGTSINKYCYITCRYLPPFFDHRIRIQYTKTEACRSIEEIQHPSVREVLRFLKIDRGLEIHHDGDLPARSGMASSSAFTVGLLHALYALLGKMPNKHRLAMEAIHVEQNMIKETVGSQDQVLTAYGGFNRVHFASGGEIIVNPITVSPDTVHELNDHFMLFFTGISRFASNVAERYVPTLKEKEKQLNEMRNMVDGGITLLGDGGDICDFGRLLHEAWELKQSLGSNISNPDIEDIYKAAISAGALGGKILGAGGGGFILFFVPPEKQEEVRKKMKEFLSVPFKFEFHGSQIIFYGEEEDYSEHDNSRIKCDDSTQTCEESVKDDQ